MHLVYIESQNEQDFLILNLPHDDDFWIGLKGLTWFDGSGLTYSNFGPNAFNEEGLCFRIQESNSQWLDRACSMSFNYICEKEDSEYNSFDKNI